MAFLRGASFPRTALSTTDLGTRVQDSSSGGRDAIQSTVAWSSIRAGSSSEILTVSPVESFSSYSTKSFTSYAPPKRPD